MVKCPHCGSTAQMRNIDNRKMSRHLWEIWDCCGCKRRFSFFYSLELISTEDITPAEDE